MSEVKVKVICQTFYMNGKQLSQETNIPVMKALGVIDKKLWHRLNGSLKKSKIGQMSMS